MDISNPLRTLTNTVEADVLAVLDRTHAPLTGARVASLAERSESQVRDVLRRLESHGLVASERYGKTSNYVLNREHVLAEVVIRAAAAADRVEELIGDLVGRWAIAPHAVVLFGSFARRDGGEDSDVDIFLVRPDTVEDGGPWAEQRYELARRVEAWTGNHAQILEVSAGELADAVRRDVPLIQSLRDDGRCLAGDAGALLDHRKLTLR